jgi:uncharacterized membrane protein YidH (DUF202 family)
VNIVNLAILSAFAISIGILGYAAYQWVQVKKKKKAREIITPLEKKNLRRALSVGIIVIVWGVILLISILLAHFM